MLKASRIFFPLALSLLLGVSAAFAQNTNTDLNKPNAVRKVGPDTWPANTPDARNDNRRGKIGAGQKTTGKAEAASDPLALKSQNEKDQGPEIKKGDSITDAMKASEAENKNQPATTTGTTESTGPAGTGASLSTSGSNQTTATTPAANSAPAPAQQNTIAGQTPPPSANTSTDTKGAASIRLGTNAEGRVALNEDQRREVSTAIRKTNVQPLANVSFAVRVGSVVPRDVRLVTVSSGLVEVLPQFRGYRFFRTREEIVIVEPATLKIVALVPLGGPSTANVPSRPVAATRTISRSATRIRTTTGSARIEDEAYVDRRPVLIEREITYPRRRTIIIERVPPAWMN